MIRYRCPHCAATISAHERRAGQSSVCKACLKPHAIPADKSQWLTEAGESLQQPVPLRAEVPVAPPVAVPSVMPPVVIDLEPVGSVRAPSLDLFEPLAPTRPDIQL